MDNSRPTWAEIDLEAIKHNIRSIRLAAPAAKMMAIVKANAYGHGMVKIAQTCQGEDVDFFGVASLQEALDLQAAGIKAPILVLGYIPEEYAEEVVQNNIRVTICNFDFARALSQAARKLSKRALLHIKVDTGMGRLGFFPDAASLSGIDKIASLPGIYMEGIFTHFAEADLQDKAYTLEQLNLFNGFVGRLKEKGIDFPIKHCANSAAIMDINNTHLNMVRAGIIIYGLYPSHEVRKENLNLIPAMKLKSRISFLKSFKAGMTIGYGRTFCCREETLVATIPIGYADGYNRLLSNRAWAVVKGQRVPLIGAVCMDQCMFDVTKVKGVKEGDEIILFGRPEDGVTADDLAEMQGTINYEIVCSVSARVPRKYI
ncbi:MAG: alanine racemase [Syntrophomonadaceae bacterium]|jgi:alanine racemase